MSTSRFDPTRHLRPIQVNGQALDYLDVRWRLVWLRREHPEARIATDHVQITADLVVFRATVEVPGQGSATGYGSAPGGEPDAVERAETRALGRALLTLGYGTEYAEDYILSETGALASSPSDPASTPGALASSPGAPAPPAGPPTLPPGVTVGPGGARTLPARLAAVFAQAQPIVDEPPVEPPPALASEPVATVSPPSEPVAPAAPSEAPARPSPAVAPAAPPTTAAAGPEPRRMSSPSSAPPARPSAPVGTPAPAAPPPPRRFEPGRAAPTSLGSTLRERPDEADRGRAPEREIAGPPRPRPARGQPAPGDAFDADEADDGDDPQADTDWTSFWRWARRRGYSNKDDVEQAIDQPIRGRTPKELRTLIMNLEADL